jgi:hypothetical protein
MRGNPRDDVLLVSARSLRTLVGERDPGIPRRHVVDVEEAARFDFRSATCEVRVGEVDE